MTRLGRERASSAGAADRSTVGGGADPTASRDPRGAGFERRRLVGAVAIALVGPAIIVALCWIRSPALLTEGRFWAEDSMFVGHMAAAHSFLDKVFYVYKGHLELISALAHAVASDINPKMAPLLTGSVDLLIECILGYMLVYFREDLGVRLPAALALCALLVVSPAASEHYLNMLNSQWLDSAILFLLINLPQRRLARHPIVVVAATLLLGLSGISSVVLMPVAGLYAIRWRSRPHGLIAAALLFCCGVQGYLIATHEFGNRFQSVSPMVYLVAPFVQVVVKHLMGVDAENNLAEWFRRGPMAAGAVSPFLVLPLGLLAWMAARVCRDRVSHTGLLILSFVFVTAINEIGALGDRNDMVGVYMMRYFFLPSLIAGLILARATPAAAGRLSPAHGALLIALVVSAIDFFGNGYNATLVTRQHAWRREVDQCRLQVGPCHIEISPGGYVVDLPTAAP